jgi:uroporphyrinogen decarboxylase
VLRGERRDGPPNFDIFMTRAAHHIGARLSDYYLDHRVLCAANLAVLEDFGLDIVQAISDPYREAADTGLEVEFPADALPSNKTPLITDWAQLPRVRFPVSEFGPRMTDRLQAIQRLRAAVGDEVPVMGWVEGALAEAADLRGVGNAMMDLLMNPGRMKELLEQCVEVEIAFAVAQFALPYERRIFEAVNAAGGIGRLHICGNTTHLLEDMGDSGAAIVDVDWMVDLRRATATMHRVAVGGNIDPVSVFLQGTPAQVCEAVLANAAAGGTRWISAAGCEIPDGTPDENLHSQRRALEELGA